MTQLNLLAHSCLFLSCAPCEISSEWQGKKKDLMAASKFASNLHQDSASGSPQSGRPLLPAITFLRGSSTNVFFFSKHEHLTVTELDFWKTISLHGFHEETCGF